MTDERKALEEAFREVWPEGSDEWFESEHRFTAMLDCGAYLSAAEMLVPERCWVRLDDWPRDIVHGAVASVCPLVNETGNPVYSATGDTPALALLGAIREARKNDE